MNIDPQVESPKADSNLNRSWLYSSRSLDMRWKVTGPSFPSCFPRRINMTAGEISSSLQKMKNSSTMTHQSSDTSLWNDRSYLTGRLHDWEPSQRMSRDTKFSNTGLGKLVIIFIRSTFSYTLQWHHRIILSGAILLKTLPLGNIFRTWYQQVTWQYAKCFRRST